MAGHTEEKKKATESFSDNRTSMLKWKYTLYTTILFLLLANPYVFKLVQKLLGKFVTIARDGCPTTKGLLVHALVFTFVLRFLMD